MIPEKFRNFKSYSRYRGYGSEYNLSDKYFAKIVNGSLLCTDDECDISSDGNVCLVTPEGACYHIGTIPMTEDGSSPIFSFEGNKKLIIRYRVFYDESHHHSGYETVECSLTVTADMILKDKLARIAYLLEKNCRGAFRGRNIRSDLRFDYDLKNLKIEIHGLKVRPGYKSYTFTQYLQFTEKGWVLQPCEDGKTPMLDEEFAGGPVFRQCMESLNFYTYRFYIGSDFSTNEYSVVDKTDGSVEWYSPDQIREFYNSGFKICGVWKSLKAGSYFRIKPVIMDFAKLGSL